jgi:hypothetical protein
MKFKDITDQAAHFLVALLVVFIAAHHSGFLACALTGACIGAVREITEEGEVSFRAVLSVFQSRRSLLDIAFWSFGGGVAGLIA